MAQIVEDWYRQMPIITRSYLTLSVLTTAGCALEVITPHAVYLNPNRVVRDWEIWRLVTNFFYFGKLGKCLVLPFLALFHLNVVVLFIWLVDPISNSGLMTLENLFDFVECLVIVKIYIAVLLKDNYRPVTHIWDLCGLRILWRLRTPDLDFLFHMFFLARYCKLLEETSFRGRTADFFFMLLFGGTLLTLMFLGGACMAFFLPIADIYFLSNSLTFMMVYVWSKRNPNVQMSFLGLFSFTAPYLPWVLLGFSVMVASSPWVDLLGMAAGHAYYFLEDVYPIMTGRRILKTPGIIKTLFPEDVVVVRPGPANG